MKSLILLFPIQAKVFVTVICWIEAVGWLALVPGEKLENSLQLYLWTGARRNSGCFNWNRSPHPARKLVSKLSRSLKVGSPEGAIEAIHRSFSRCFFDEACEWPPAGLDSLSMQLQFLHQMHGNSSCRATYFYDDSWHWQFGNPMIIYKPSICIKQASRLENPLQWGPSWFRWPFSFLCPPLWLWVTLYF